MDWTAWITLAVLAGTLYLLTRDRFAPSLTLVGALVALLVTGVIGAEEALSGFSNPAPITVAALFVLAGAVEKTGALQPLVSGFLDGAAASRSVLARILVPTAGASAFLNNTPTVAMLAPQVRGWAERHGVSPSRFLMPLSFASILGGTVTLIGTSTNIVVSGLLQGAGHPPLGMFELTAVALPAALAGLGVLILLGPVLLPERRSLRQQATDEVREFVVNMRVLPGGALDGQTVEGARLRNLQGLFLVEAERERELIAPVAPTLTLRGGDRLTFVGRADQVVDLQRTRGLVSTERDHMLLFDSPEHTFFEVVIGQASPLAGRTLKDADFRERYQAAVVAIHRSGRRVKAKLGQVRLRVGDTLLLLADPGFGERWRDRNHFLLVSRLGGAPPAATRQAWIVGVVAIFVIGTAATGLMPILHSALLGALALVAVGVLTPGEARSAVDLDVIVVIAAAFGVGAAMQASGLAAGVAHLLIGSFGTFGAVGALVGLVVTTILLTELITNNAAAVLVFPIAITVAAELGIDPRPVAIAIAIVASASFLTPIGYQTNTMVYGLGGYRFSDYARLGAPLTLVVVVTVVWITARSWS